MPSWACLHSLCYCRICPLHPGYLAYGHTFCICVPTSVFEYFFLCHCSWLSIYFGDRFSHFSMLFYPFMCLVLIWYSLLSFYFTNYNFHCFYSPALDLVLSFHPSPEGGKLGDWFYILTLFNMYINGGYFPMSSTFSTAPKLWCVYLHSSHQKYTEGCFPLLLPSCSPTSFSPPPLVWAWGILGIEPCIC